MDELVIMSVFFSLLNMLVFYRINRSQTFLSGDTMTREVNDMNDPVLGYMSDGSERPL